MGLSNRQAWLNLVGRPCDSSLFYASGALPEASLQVGDTTLLVLLPYRIVGTEFLDVARFFSDRYRGWLISGELLRDLRKQFEQRGYQVDAPVWEELLQEDAAYQKQLMEGAEGFVRMCLKFGINLETQPMPELLRLYRQFREEMSQYPSEGILDPNDAWARAAAREKAQSRFEPLVKYPAEFDFSWAPVIEAEYEEGPEEPKVRTRKIVWEDDD